VNKYFFLVKKPRSRIEFAEYLVFFFFLHIYLNPKIITQCFCRHFCFHVLNKPHFLILGFFLNGEAAILKLDGESLMSTIVKEVRTG